MICSQSNYWDIDVLVISKTKLDASFPIDQFKIAGLSTPFSRDRDQYGGGLHVCVREDITAKHLSRKSTSIEGIYVELNFRKKNWILLCTYNPHRNIITNNLEALQTEILSQTI